MNDSTIFSLNNSICAMSFPKMRSRMEGPLGARGICA